MVVSGGYGYRSSPFPSLSWTFRCCWCMSNVCRCLCLRGLLMARSVLRSCLIIQWHWSTACYLWSYLTNIERLQNWLSDYHWLSLIVRSSDCRSIMLSIAMHYSYIDHQVDIDQQTTQEPSHNYWPAQPLIARLPDFQVISKLNFEHHSQDCNTIIAPTLMFRLTSINKQNYWLVQPLTAGLPEDITATSWVGLCLIWRFASGQTQCLLLLIVSVYQVWMRRALMN